VALYERPHRLDPLAPPFVAAYGFVIVAALAVVLLRKRLPGLASAAVVYVVVLAPVLGLAQTGPQLVADKYSYISCIGWSVLVGGALAWVWCRRGRDPWSYVAGGASAAVVLVLVALTVRQTAVWHDTWSLWRHALAVRPSAAAHTGYAILLREDGRIEEAISHFDAALAILPDYGTAWLNRGVAQHKLGRLDEAERCYRTALEHIYDKHNAYNNLGQLCLDRLKATRDPAQLQQALEAFGAAVAYVEQHPEAFSPQPYLGLGIAQLIAGRLDAARASLVTAQRYQETHAAATQQLQVLEQLARQSRER
jgi:tetratricopeptide (TPR) repeat protein